MYYSDLNFSIDVSGTPYGKTIIGCIILPSKNSTQITSKFKKKFKKCWSIKGKDLTNNQLEKILDYLDKNRIKSLTLCLNANDWDYNLSKIDQNKAYKKEKIFGILYFMALSMYSIPKKSYSVTVCEENFMDIKTVISSCRTIARMRGIDYSFSVASGRYNDSIKIADYIASCGRNIKRNKLNQYSFHRNKNKIKLPPLFIKKVFS